MRSDQDARQTWLPRKSFKKSSHDSPWSANESARSNKAIDVSTVTAINISHDKLANEKLSGPMGAAIAHKQLQAGAVVNFEAVFGVI